MSDRNTSVGGTYSDQFEESLLNSDFGAEYERLRPYEEFARTVVRRRAAPGLSLADLAGRMGVDTSTVSTL